ncbi:hypothetical protein EYF80_016567 [Liparis tanakae]|uniref:Uncharacterized protein n=1 Tax=Liparis tanakae TaxID=230148 RepID=A0A4Z2I5A9_9TELE|nr:hypothetical protein EYF80_016567 [Liparis tanakae]
MSAWTRYTQDTLQKAIYDGRGHVAPQDHALTGARRHKPGLLSHSVGTCETKSDDSPVYLNHNLKLLSRDRRRAFRRRIGATRRPQIYEWQF